jgi:hypothetical protein
MLLCRQIHEKKEEEEEDNLTTSIFDPK